jgi:uncharacterized membrane protein YuzA (DUF378 family)
MKNVSKLLKLISRVLLIIGIVNIGWWGINSCEPIYAVLAPCPNYTYLLLGAVLTLVCDLINRK